MILVFKTNVKLEQQVDALKPYLSKEFPKAKWNFDLEDCDKILRIVTDNDISMRVKKLLKLHHFECQELE